MIKPGWYDVDNDTCKKNHSKEYRPVLTAAENAKGVLDIDTVKGCRLGIEKYP